MDPQFRHVGCPFLAAAVSRKVPRHVHETFRKNPQVPSGANRNVVRLTTRSIREPALAAQRSYVTVPDSPLHPAFEGVPKRIPTSIVPT